MTHLQVICYKFAKASRHQLGKGSAHLKKDSRNATLYEPECRMEDFQHHQCLGEHQHGAGGAIGSRNTLCRTEKKFHQSILQEIKIY